MGAPPERLQEPAPRPRPICEEFVQSATLAAALASTLASITIVAESPQGGDVGAGNPLQLELNRTNPRRLGRQIRTISAPYWSRRERPRPWQPSESSKSIKTLSEEVVSAHKGLLTARLAAMLS